MNKDVEFIMTNILASKDDIREVALIGDTKCRVNDCGKDETVYVVFTDGLITHLCEEHMNLYKSIRFELDNKVGMFEEKAPE